MLKRLIFLLIILLINPQAGLGQSRHALEKKRQQLSQQIHRIGEQLKQTQTTEKNALEIYRMRREKINYQQKLIENLQKELQQINRKIREKNDSLQQLNKDLALLKEKYAEAVRKAYKISGKEKILFFVLSADNFQQAVRRVRYIREYADYLKRQARDIEYKQKEIQAIRRKLTAQKHRKQNMLTRLADEKKQMLKEQQKQEQLIASLRKKKSYYLKQIRRKQREAQRIDRQIRKLIAREIARRNKARGKKGRNEFALTPAGKALAKSFAANKGRLPWPVKHGYVSRRFGVQPHPVFRNVKITNSGIYITTPPHEKVYSVFDGEVMMIQVIPGANTAVHIRHGNYISIYLNLENVQVHQGQKIRKGQYIGQVAKDPSTGTYILKFKIYKNLHKLNPLLWLARK